ncbi:dienelactone hydrolase family protein [Phytomonospora endophytica]|uniref:Carboxymethylenebutenolidase n=1 Tax=Phytomonospora endophytica TaxID=714109 RepID=A0A841FRI9_9ACTN|nr:dienelactone hydrolase family protein [Phytomonospora endophytica]MBB6034570.1 carboxymethylenebutenolidase [Phytomonospora endophytica]GIG71370.1 carboxymethylenebutenolidase [Phytomonospora endophytica]
MQEFTTAWTALGEGRSAYVATPAESRGTVLVAAEIFGVSGHVRDMCDGLAREGFTAVAPDFYWRDGTRLEFGYDDAGRTEAMAHMRRLDRDGVLADLAAARTLAGDTVPAIVGFSLGGHIALLAATEAPYALAVDFYGGWTIDGGVPLAEPAPPLAEAASIAALGTPVLLLAGAEDHLIGDDEWERIGRRLTNYGVSHERVRYAGIKHGFMCAERPEWDEAIAHDAWQRMTDTLRKRLG